MPPKTGLLGTLSAIALGAGLAVGLPAGAQDQTDPAELEFIEFVVNVCERIDTTSDADVMLQIVTLLEQQCRDETDQVRRNYCTACLARASAKYATLIEPGAPPPAIPPH